MFHMTKPNHRIGRRARVITASATAALALTMGATVPATAEPAAPENETQNCSTVVVDAKVYPGVEWAKQQRYINPDKSWVRDYRVQQIARMCGEVHAAAVYPTETRDAAPMAVLLFHPWTGDYVTTAIPPHGFDAGPEWGPRVGRAVDRGWVTAPDELTIVWRNHFGDTKAAKYRFHDGPDGGYYETLPG